MKKTNLFSKLSSENIKKIQSLKTPEKIQDFLNTFKRRPEGIKEIVRPINKIFESGSANCMEGAILAAAILMYNSEKPLLLDLKVSPRNNKDVDHVVTIFKKGKYFGALSKTSHAVLRYREPIYSSVRELAMSYFHEYFTDDGKKNLRSYSEPFDISRKFGTKWTCSNDDLYEIACALDESRHFPFLPKDADKKLRLADKIEIEAGKMIEEF